MNDTTNNTETETKRYTIRRDGKKDFVFTGVKLGSSSDYENQGPQNSRWHEIEMYKTNAGKYVVAQCYVTCWQGEEDSRRADVCESAAEVLELLSWEDEESNAGLSDLAKEALVEAAENDSAFKGLTL